jgi:hypothetical protein
MEQRPLGSQGLVASAQGLGAMGMTAFYKPSSPEADEAEALRAISRALSLGMNSTSYRHRLGVAERGGRRQRGAGARPRARVCVPVWQQAAW